MAVRVSTIVDALGIERFAVMGHSGGGPHALACAALLPERVRLAMPWLLALSGLRDRLTDRSRSG
ncbi:MAG: Hydrolase, alpha/beta fold family [uncultured Thermomicrobiales bacterium]|uniref:Hydrolase, alpha/beta fold family n=1 Tax=uncultured Thermomicrobiales bacterium TaxID=1645740 RepID=A0A6J4UBM9_9BACT|nr:MAG: Hydrolase, alpha/beta fold family [uncultured Thermomicrobiales bacterium]